MFKIYFVVPGLYQISYAAKSRFCKISHKRYDYIVYSVSLSLESDLHVLVNLMLV